LRRRSRLELFRNGQGGILAMREAGMRALREGYELAGETPALPGSGQNRLR